MGYKAEGEGKNLNKFFSYIHRVTRETDIKGLISEDIVGLILPDTDRDGTQTCIRKFIQGNGHFPYSVVSATYPDALFQKLLNEAEDQPDLFPLNLDQVIMYHGFQLFLKRVIDVVGSLVGLIIFSPLFLDYFPGHQNKFSRGRLFSNRPAWARGGEIRLFEIPVDVCE